MMGRVLVDLLQRESMESRKKKIDHGGEKKRKEEKKDGMQR